MTETTKQRIDLELVRRGLAPSRARAAQLIKDGCITIDGKPATKASQNVATDAHIQAQTSGQQWVGRGALKLLGALSHFDIDPADKTCLDLGASTGGFTQVLIEKGARKVYAVDVGHDQLHPLLKNEPKIVSMEGVNARYLSEDQIPDPIDLLVCDASFISLKKLLPASLKRCREGAVLVALIKPQFEVGKGNLGKGGVVRDPELVEQVRHDIETWLAHEMKWRVIGVIESPVRGSDGNTEFLIGAVNEP